MILRRTITQGPPPSMLHTCYHVYTYYTVYVTTSIKVHQVVLVHDKKLKKLGPRVWGLGFQEIKCFRA